MMRFIILSLILTFPVISCKSSKMPDLTNQYATVYEVSMPNPSDHYFEVKVTINDPAVLAKDFVDFKMATWTPGSYLIREYAKNLESLVAKSGGKEISADKISKDTWRIKGNNGKAIEVSYRLYAYELTVRTNFLDASHGYFNGAATFLYVPELMDKKCLVKIQPHASFAKVSVALPEVAKNSFEAENYDLLVDSPFEIGNQEILEFEALGVKHTIANYSMEKLNFDEQKVLEDYKKVVEASHSIFGGQHPCKDYLFIIHHLPNIGGGLEHLNSTTCQTSPNAYANQSAYNGFMGLVAHEYFHLWNVKRLRPVALGPFDYQIENYTHMLWVSEGFTSYYQNDILRRADMISVDEMLGSIAGAIGNTENRAGNKVQSLAESSWDAWIKFYRPNENSDNSTVSYYTKGGVIANILNMIIIGNTNGEKSLDNVLQNLYQDLYLKKDIGFTDEQFMDECSKVAGEDLSGFFKKYVFDTGSLDYTKYFDKVDVKASLPLANPGKPSFGATTRMGIVRKVDAGTAAYEGGINVNDQILKVDGKAYSSDEDFIKGKAIGDIVKVTVNRSGVELTYDIKLKEDSRIRVILEPKYSADANAKKRFNKWMHLD